MENLYGANLEGDLDEANLEDPYRVNSEKLKTLMRKYDPKDRMSLTGGFTPRTSPPYWRGGCDRVTIGSLKVGICDGCTFAGSCMCVG